MSVGVQVFIDILRYQAVSTVIIVLAALILHRSTLHLKTALRNLP